MKRVVIEMRKGKPVVVSCPTKIEVVIREERKRSMRKVWRTLVYRVRTALRA